jgi:hypothetical protein
LINYFEIINRREEEKNYTETRGIFFVILVENAIVPKGDSVKIHLYG